MRFQNWDVLVFPATDATPIQEFTTEFCNIPDPDHAFLSKMTSDDPETLGKEELKALPTVSTYIPMLVPGTPFQISIHSWTQPQVVATIEAGQQAMIEARLFIDGVPITYVVCPASSSWPMVVDSYPVNSAFGTRKRNLTFPAFNQDSLNQWANGDTELGRIKIVISEGIAGTIPLDDEVSYMRLKNIVCFYYRYAPQEFLESVGIYYPTTRKYDNSLARWFPVSVPAHHRAGSAFGSPAHKHSPIRKPTTPASVPPVFELNSAIPSLEKTPFPDLQPISVKSTPSDPFSIDVQDKHNIGSRTVEESEHHNAGTLSKGKVHIDTPENSTAQIFRSACQTPASSTPIFEAILPTRMRTDSISSMHSQQSTNSFKLEYTEQQSTRGKEDYADPSISKSVKIGIITETQNQMQSAHGGQVGEDTALPAVKDLAALGKVDIGRSSLPLVELDNIL